MPESKNSQRLTKTGKPRKTKKYKRAFLSATAESILLSEMPENQEIVGLWKWFVPIFYTGS